MLLGWKEWLERLYKANQNKSGSRGMAQVVECFPASTTLLVQTPIPPKK
jgi:hypothetical protein